MVFNNTVIIQHLTEGCVLVNQVIAALIIAFIFGCLVGYAFRLKKGKTEGEGWIE